MPQTQSPPLKAPTGQVHSPAVDRFFDLALDMLCIVGPDGAVLRVNPAFEGALGYASDEIRGRRLRDLIHPDDAPAAHAQIGSIRAGTAGGALRARYRHADGSYRIVSWRLSPPDEDGLVYTAGRDVTDSETARGHVVATLERLTDALVSLDRDWRITYANPTALAMGRLTREAAIGRVIWEVVPGLRETRFGAAYERAMAERVKTSTEDFFAPLDLWVRADAYPSEDGLTLYLRDVSTAREAREQLRLHTAILESMGQAVVATDPAGRITVWNAAAERQYGWTAGEVLGRDVADVTASPASLARSRQLAMEVAAGGCWSGELVNRRKDGTELELALTLAPVHDDAGALSAMVGVSTDISERNRVERALRESEARFRQLAESIDAAVWLGDLGGATYYVSPAIWRLLGEDELVGAALPLAEVGTRWSAAIHPDDRARVHAAWAAPESSSEVEYRVVRQDGSVRHVRTRVSPVRDERGVVHRQAAVTYDVTDARAAEEALRSSERFNHVLLDSSTDCVKLLDLDGRVEFVNENGLALMELEPGASVRGMEWAGRPGSAGHERIAGAVATARVGGTARFQGYRPTARGTPKWWDVTVTPIRDASGTVVRLLSVSREITEMKRAEDELRESRRVLATLFANLPGLAYRCRYEASYALELASDGAAELTGYSPAELVRGDVAFADLIHPDDREPVWREVQRAVERRESFRLNYRLCRRDGAERWVWEQGRAVYAPDGRPLALEGFVTDVTERRVAEEQLRQAQKMEAVGQLAGGVAHDFNNLLTVIQAYTEFLAEQLDESNPLHGDVVAIQRAAGRAASLTRQLLAFSRKQVLQPRTLDLNGVVGGMEPMLHRLIGEDIRVAMRTEPQLGRVKADPGQLEQVVMNLAVNARDAMPQGGTLTIETANVRVDAARAAEHGVGAGPFVRLVVRDTGCGMDEATRSRVFEPFFTTKEVGRGTGLGLSTVYGIVKQSEGFVTCESAPGTGTTFAVYLPRVDVAADRAAEPSARAASPARGTETVLLVEDEAAVRALGRRILERHGYTVLEAKDGADALRVAADREGRIHLLVTDIVMPELGGSQLYDALRAAGRADLRVLYVSGYADDDITRRGAPSAGHSFLQKPFSPAALAAAARAALDVAA